MKRRYGALKLFGLPAFSHLLQRRHALLAEMQRRKKVGGILDKRFGEDDPTLTPDERALQRFAREKQRQNGKAAMFDLEDAEAGDQLTHLGQSLSLGGASRLDDFQESDIEAGNDESGEEDPFQRPTKKRRLSDDDEISTAQSSGPDIRNEPPKSRKEVMEEVIAKSKLHKYERQQAKEDDDDLRAELDSGMAGLFDMLGSKGRQKPKPPAKDTTDGLHGSMNPDRLAMLEGKDRSQAEKEYDQRVRQMLLDQRSKPTERTLTEEERLEREADRLKDLEAKRVRRMRGEPELSDEDQSGDPESEREMDQNLEATNVGKDNSFGLGLGLEQTPKYTDLGVEDEDDFIIDDDLVTDGSLSSIDDEDIEGAGRSSVDSQGYSSSDDITDGNENNDDDDQMLGATLVSDDARQRRIAHDPNDEPQGQLAYTYPCPQNHPELLKITESLPIEEVPTMVQRIRSLYHPKLGSENKAKLGVFAMVMIEHIHYLANATKHPPFSVLESLVRHVHSMSKMFPIQVGQAFRSQLEDIIEQRSRMLQPGDLVILTAIGSIFPTSDHFHQVVTPALLCMTTYLGQSLPKTIPELVTGTYICSLCLSYQQLSKRYVPEVINYLLNAITSLVPTNDSSLVRDHPNRSLSPSFALHKGDIGDSSAGHISFWDMADSSGTKANDARIKEGLLRTLIANTGTMAELWASKSAFCEIMGDMHQVVNQIGSKSRFSSIVPADIRKQARSVSLKIHVLMQQSLQTRQPLRLHNHRPLPIKTSFPKFEESYDPSKHYDPDRERSDLSKLKAEHKKERKGALRELRKDASFMARESLKEKKERDQAYEKKFKRLVAEIQGEEGREGKMYEREKRMRKAK